ncbi:MAG: LTA synthase family protein [Bacillota bacterium]|nr:LTA synthase family protein [Bacillota bacterium]
MSRIRSKPIRHRSRDEILGDLTREKPADRFHTATSAVSGRPFARSRFAGRIASAGQHPFWITSTGILLLLLTAMISFWIVEAYTHDPFAMKQRLQLLNVGIWLALELFFLTLTAQVRAAATLTIASATTVGLANYLVMSFRSTPLVPWDLNSAGTAMSVLDNYSFPWDIKLLGIGAVAALAILLASRARLRLVRHDAGIWPRLRVRLLTLPLAVALCVGLFVALLTPGLHEFFQIDGTLFTPTVMYRKNGFMATFLSNYRYLRVREPEGYSIAAIEDIAAPYLELERDGEAPSSGPQTSEVPLPRNAGRNDASAGAGTGSTAAAADLPRPSAESTAFSQPAGQDEADTAAGTEVFAARNPLGEGSTGTQGRLPAATQTLPDVRPDIIVIMNEAFSDPAVLDDFTTNRDYMPFFRSLTENAIRGFAEVSIVGGNTATSEFEFLTGDSMYWLPAGSVAFQQYINGEMPGLVSLMNDLGYRTVGLHPYHAKGWDRQRVYEQLGFQESVFLETFRHRSKLRNYVTDAAVYDEIDIYRKTSTDAEPLFAFAVTMQNHGGYSAEFDNFPHDLQALSPRGSRYFDTYLSLIERSDQALADFVQRLERAGRPTILLFFGDHQPNEYVVEHLMPDTGEWEPGERYLVPYVIWANFDLPESSGWRTSLNFLAGQLLNAAGLPKSPWFYFLDDVCEEVPVLTQHGLVGRDGRRYERIEDSPYAELLGSYELLQYNHLLDSRHRVTELFRLIP